MTAESSAAAEGLRGAPGLRLEGTDVPPSLYDSSVRRKYRFKGAEPSKQPGMLGRMAQSKRGASSRKNIHLPLMLLHFLFKRDRSSAFSLPRRSGSAEARARPHTTDEGTIALA